MCWNLILMGGLFFVKKIKDGHEKRIGYSTAARGGNLAKIPPNQVIADFGTGSSVESESE